MQPLWLHPHYVIFELPLLVAFFLAAMQMMGIGGHSDMDHDVDVDHDFDSDMDHDVDHDIDHDADHDADGEQENSGPGLFERALSLLGMGRVPVMVVLSSFMAIFGVIGIVMNQIVEAVPLNIPGHWLASIGVAWFTAVFGTRFSSLAIASIMPKSTSYAATKADLVGRSGKAVFDISDTFGRVLVMDAFGNQQQVKALSDHRIQAGEEVILTGFNPETDSFSVRQVEPVASLQQTA